MSQTTILLIAVIVVVVLALLWFLTRGRKQKVSFTDAPKDVAMAPRAEAKPIVQPAAPPAPTVPAPGEGHGVGSEVSAAIEDVVDQFVGIDAHESGQAFKSKAGDDLTRLKGLGPKAATTLTAIGVTTFAQMAAWNDADIDAIDAQLGAFKGRIRRDRWVEQAQFLAKGDVAGFEEAFGKLG